MVHQARELSPAQKAAAELLLGRRLDDGESISVHAFEASDVPETRRREVREQLQKLFAEVDLSLAPASEEEAEDVFTEAMRSSRPGYRTRQ
jgi:uncharacterized protein (UPF0210 family)